MRILFINTFYEPIELGGAERTLRLVVEGMLSRGHEVHVVSLSSDLLSNGASPASYTSNFPVRNIYTPNGKTAQTFRKKMVWHGLDLYNPVAARDLAGVFRHFKPDVVSCHNLSGWSIAAWDVARRYDVPIVQVLHDYYLMCISSMRARGGLSCVATCAKCKAFRLPHKWKSKSVSAVVGISDHILSQFLDDGFFSAATPNRIYNVGTARQNAIIPSEYPKNLVFGFIGRLAPHKGIETALNAFHRAKLPDGSIFLIAGEGETGYVADLRHRFECTSVRFLGRQEPSDFFPRLSWTIVPSISDEPLGRVVFESHGYGVPVLGSRRGGIPEMIADGQTGFLFEAGNVNQLSTLMQSVSKGTEIKSRNEIISNAAPFFDTDRFLVQYEAVYRSVLG